MSRERVLLNSAGTPAKSHLEALGTTVDGYLASQSETEGDANER